MLNTLKIKFVRWLLSSKPVTELLADELVNARTFADTMSEIAQNKAEDAADEFERHLHIDADDVRNLDDYVSNALDDWQRGFEVDAENIRDLDQAFAEVIDNMDEEALAALGERIETALEVSRARKAAARQGV